MNVEDTFYIPFRSKLTMPVGGPRCRRANEEDREQPSAMSEARDAIKYRGERTVERGSASTSLRLDVGDERLRRRSQNTCETNVAAKCIYVYWVTVVRVRSTRRDSAKPKHRTCSYEEMCLGRRRDDACEGTRWGIGFSDEPWVGYWVLGWTIWAMRAHRSTEGYDAGLRSEQLWRAQAAGARGCHRLSS